MACKLWKNILPDKIRNRKAEVLLIGFGLKSRYSDSCNIANMAIQHKIEDASDLQSGGGKVGDASMGVLMLP